MDATTRSCLISLLLIIALPLFLLLRFRVIRLRWPFRRSIGVGEGATSGPEGYFARIRTLDQIYALDPISFERFAKTLFERMGYQAKMTRMSGDEGIDLQLEKDGEHFVCQCKRYRGSVGQPVLRDLYGALVHEQARQAFLVTTGTFTLPAEQWSQGKPIRLVDGDGLIEWIKQFPEPQQIDMSGETRPTVNLWPGLWERVKLWAARLGTGALILAAFGAGGVLGLVFGLFLGLLVR